MWETMVSINPQSTRPGAGSRAPAGEAPSTLWLVPRETAGLECQGEFDAIDFVRTLIDMGVDVPWSLEVCNDGAWGHPGADHVRAVADAMRDVLARARHAQPEEMP